MSHRESASHVHVAPSAARDALVALRNVEHLTKSPRVGHSVVVDLLPEVRAGLGRLDEFFLEMWAKRGVAERCGVGRLAIESLARVTEAVELVASARQKSASARLRLERTLGEDVPKLEGCVEVCEIWVRASADLRTELRLRDVVAAVLEPCAPEDPAVVWTTLPSDPLAIVADASIVVWLLRCALAEPGPAALVATAPRDGEPGLEILRAPQAKVAGVPMSPRVPAPKVVYLDALEQIATRAHVRFAATDAGIVLGFEAPQVGVRETPTPT